MSQVITNRVRLSRRTLLKGLTAAGARDRRRPAAAGLDVQLARAPRMRRQPPAGTRKGRSRAASCSGSTATASRSATGFPPRQAPTIAMTPCLSPLAPFRNDIHVLSGLDNAAARAAGQRSSPTR